MKFEDVKVGMYFTLPPFGQAVYIVFAKNEKWIFTLGINKYYGITRIIKSDVQEYMWNSGQYIYSSMKLYKKRNGHAKFIKRLFKALKEPGMEVNIDSYTT